MLRGRQLAGRWLGLFIVILVLASFTPVAAEPTMVKLNSRELKLLIDTDVFAYRRDGYALCWGIVKELAGDKGIQVVEAEDPFAEGARKVMYLDTSSEQLGKENLTLRLRIKLKDGKLADKVDLNLKYRKRGADAVPSDAVTAAAGIECTYKYEEDIAGFVEGVVGKNATTGSLGCTIKGVPEKELIGNSLGVYADYYPSLAMLGIPLDSQLEMIAGAAIREYKVTPGELDFGQGMSTEVDISVWYNFDNDKIVTAEISYESTLGPDSPVDAVARAVEFFNALQEKMSTILVPGGMKTQLLRDSVK